MMKLVVSINILTGWLVCGIKGGCEILILQPTDEVEYLPETCTIHVIGCHFSKSFLSAPSMPC